MGRFDPKAAVEPCRQAGRAGRHPKRERSKVAKGRRTKQGKLGLSARRADASGWMSGNSSHALITVRCITDVDFCAHHSWFSLVAH
jgi:hypothetical protein